MSPGAEAINTSRIFNSCHFPTYKKIVNALIDDDGLNLKLFWSQLYAMHLSYYSSDLVWLRTGLRQSRLLLVLHIFRMILRIYQFIFFAKKGYSSSCIYARISSKSLLFLDYLENICSSMIYSILINIFLQTYSASMVISFCKKASFYI